MYFPQAPFLLLIEVLQTDNEGEKTETDVEIDGASSDQYADSAHSIMARWELYSLGLQRCSCFPQYEVWSQENVLLFLVALNRAK